MIYRIENIQIVFEDNTRTNIKTYKPLVVHDLNDFRRRYKQSLSKRKRKSLIKHIHFTYEEYSDR